MINAFGNYIGFGQPQIYPLTNAIGSVDITFDGPDTIFTFFNTSGSTGQGTGSFWFEKDYEVEYLIVGGGGQGGLEAGGGGGGGLLSGSFIAQKGVKYDVYVGRGGWWSIPPFQDEEDGEQGVKTTVSASSLTDFGLLAQGGGGGRNSGARETSSFQNTYQGGNGGGGAGIDSFTNPGSGSLGQGNAGGSGSYGTGNFSAPYSPRQYYIGGGGGGAAQVGGSGSLFNLGVPLQNYPRPGNGGNGNYSTITGTGSYYAGGGGADSVRLLTPETYGDYTTYPTGSGGLGGANAYSSSLDRTGGGGGCKGNDYRYGLNYNAFGNGGSGVAIIRFNATTPYNP
jgi:hypothetical protein